MTDFTNTTITIWVAHINITDTLQVMQGIDNLDIGAVKYIDYNPKFRTEKYVGHVQFNVPIELYLKMALLQKQNI